MGKQLTLFLLCGLLTAFAATSAYAVKPESTPAAIPGVQLDVCVKSPKALGVKTIIELTRSDDGYDYRFFIIKVPSHPESDTQAKAAGFCGAGEEVSFHICGNPHLKKQILSIPIESCIHSIQIQDANFGNESPRTLSRAIHWDEDPIRIDWLTFNGQHAVNGVVRLVKGKAIYTGPELR